MMKAIICEKYGPPEVLIMKDVPKPKPKRNEVCMKIHATAVTASDIFIRGLNIPFRYRIAIRLMIGFFKPRKSIIGLVLAGEIESVGKNVSKFKIGDEVFGISGFSLGAYAEYKCLSENGSINGCLALKPKNINFEEATAAAYGGLLALQYLEKGKIESGQKILIYGASGTSGTIAVQIAKSMGAEVTAVCSTKNMELVKSLGADKVLDYTQQTTLPENELYDFVLDAVGNMKSSKLKEACKKNLKPNGKYVSIDDGDLQLSSHRLEKLKSLCEEGQFKPILDKVYTFEQMVEAHRYVEKGHKVGGVAVKIV